MKEVMVLQILHAISLIYPKSMSEIEALCK